MAKKSKNTAISPLTAKKIKPFRRPGSKVYYVRLRVGATDKWISTKTENYEEAVERAEKLTEAYFKGELAQRAEDIKSERTKKIADTVINVLTKSDKKGTGLDAAFDKWMELTPAYTDISEKTKKCYRSVFQKFKAWCGESKIGFIEEVDHETALKYSKHLWDSKISPKTYNDHLKLLSRLFSTIDAVVSLPYRNPFSNKKIQRKKKSELQTEGHMPLEPDMLKAVIDEAARDSQDYRNLIITGSQTGLRLKDAVLLKWKDVGRDFIEVLPFKTRKTGNTARIPITATMRKMLNERRASKGQDEYVFPAIAEHYQKNEHYVTKKCTSIFEKALKGFDTLTGADSLSHRQRRGSLYSFHSLRTTYMSLLATKDVSPRDAMRILAWESMEMIKVYEKMIETYKGDADKRAIEIVNKINEFKMDVPALDLKEEPRPDAVLLGTLVEKYSNVTIGRIYDVSETAVRKWLDKHGIVRGKRIESADLPDKEIEAVRKKLQDK
ncbi:MAG: hypothetical protein A2017_02415 [Lentisphaerae bacterium GWF2_44_16]|nr:MAG: hypothetical protein A2017_02415 [Lentisphaerae bacterium GWF2_44_16]